MDKMDFINMHPINGALAVYMHDAKHGTVHSNSHLRQEVASQEEDILITKTTD